MSKIIWEELCEVVFYNFYLIEFIESKRKLLNIINVLALIFTISGILGWYKFPQQYKFWAVSIIFIQMVNFYRNKFIVSSEELVTLDIIRNFYQERQVELEKLWHDFYNDKIDEDQTDKKFRLMQNKEINTLKIYNHKKVKDIKKLNGIASMKKDNYLNRFK